MIAGLTQRLESSKNIPAHDRSYTAPNSINDSKTMGKQ